MAGQERLRIGVIGAGIGGTSCARFCRDHFGESAEIHVFEQLQRVGGRVALIEVDGRKFEAGGSIIHGKNKYMVDFAKELDIKRAPSNDSSVAIFDGDSFVFEESKFTLVTLFRLIRRYGLDMFRLKSWVNGFLSKFERVYQLQSEEKAFTTPLKLLQALDSRFPGMVHETLRSRLEKDGFGKKFIDEFCMGVCRVNYGQNTNIGAFVGSVSLAGAGADLFALEGGNCRVMEGLVKTCGATLHEGVLVERVVGRGETGYTLHARSIEDGSSFESEFDIVFLACPMMLNSRQSSPIKFENLDNSRSEKDISRKYHRTVATFIQGKLRNPFEKSATAPKEHQPDAIFTCSDSLFYNSIGGYPSTEEDNRKDAEPIWKVFSKLPLEENQVEAIFPGTKTWQARDWMAYPSYESEVDKKEASSFCIDGKNFFYVNAIESTASAMEMSAIGAMNCVLLAKNKRNGNIENIDKFSHHSKL